jgi:fructose-1,6-bisphosphatase/inositol monophosphatase family enzyme
VGTGFSYERARRQRQANVLVQVLPQVRDIRRMGSAAVDLCSVACGRLDAFYERGLGPWDLAAGALVAREAGARVGDLAGGPPSGEFVLAASSDLFEPLRALLDTAGAGSA